MGAGRPAPPTIHLPLPCLALCSWPYLLKIVQQMVNNAPTSALGGMAPTKALFGTLPANMNLPSMDSMVDLLGFTNSAQAADADAALAPATQRRSSAPQPKRRRTQLAATAASDSDDDCQLDAQGTALAQGPADSASPAARRSARSNAGGLLGLLLAEEHQGEVAEEHTRPLPQRAAALNSPVGKRRREAGLLQQLADIAAEHEDAAAPCSEEEAEIAGGEGWQRRAAHVGRVGGACALQCPTGMHAC